MTDAGSGVLTLAALLLGCAGPDRGATAWHEEPPALVVQVDLPAEGVTVASVVRVPAPTIRFQALVEPDPNHFAAVTAPVDGVVDSLAPAFHVSRGRVVAVLREQARGSSRDVSIVARAEGAWRPRRQPRQFVWQGDTLGGVWEHGTWLAVGTVSELEYGVLHRGDPALVMHEGPDAHARSGTVERVLPPGTAHPYSAEIAVEFAGPEYLPPGTSRAVAVVVTPAGPEDSLVAVPASAVVRLAPGLVVFVPVGEGRFEVRRVSVGRSRGSLITVRDGVESGTSVAAGAVQFLAAAARDSLVIRDARRRAGR